jgi:hypothetical protein
MSTGRRFLQFSGIMLLCVASLASADTTHHKRSKKAQPPPLPSGPTGPIQPIPLDSMTPVAPQVTYQDGQLTIVAANSTLGDILRAVRKQTGAEIDVPDARERVVTHLGPGPAQEVIAELLNGSRFNYVLLGSPNDPRILTRVVLVARTPESKTNRPAPQSIATLNQPTTPDQPQPDMGSDANDADAGVPEQNADQNADQPMADPDQPTQSDQPGVKTPQELLQEMQQRQLQLQQQQAPGQPPPGVQRPPQE